jgi:hypothetical protein
VTLVWLTGWRHQPKGGLIDKSRSPKELRSSRRAGPVRRAAKGRRLGGANHPLPEKTAGPAQGARPRARPRAPLRSKTILRRKEWQPCLRDWWRGNAVYDDRHEPAGTAPGRNSLGLKGLNALYTFRIGARWTSTRVVRRHRGESGPRPAALPAIPQRPWST